MSHSLFIVLSKNILWLKVLILRMAPSPSSALKLILVNNILLSVSISLLMGFQYSLLIQVFCDSRNRSPSFNTPSGTIKIALPLVVRSRPARPARWIKERKSPENDKSRFFSSFYPGSTKSPHLCRHKKKTEVTDQVNTYCTNPTRRRHLQKNWIKMILYIIL